MKVDDGWASNANDAGVAFSTSGGSENIGAPLKEAQRRGLDDHPLLVVRSDSIPRVQEAQASIYHIPRERLS